VVTDPIQVALQVAEVLERCGLRYLVGGSLASSVSGEPRSTLDVDVVVAMTEADVEPLLATLSDEFYADAGAVRRAVRARSSVNLIHQGTATKVDLFMLGGSPLDAEQMAFDLKTPWSDGTYRIELSPQELIEKLAALIPPPRLNLIRYHGILAPSCSRPRQDRAGRRKRARGAVRVDPPALFPSPVLVPIAGARVCH